MAGRHTARQHSVGANCCKMWRQAHSVGKLFGKHTAMARGEGYSLSLSLSRLVKANFLNFSRYFLSAEQISQIFAQKFLNLGHFLIDFSQKFTISTQKPRFLQKIHANLEKVKQKLTKGGRDGTSQSGYKMQVRQGPANAQCQSKRQKQGYRADDLQQLQAQYAL